VTPNWTKATDNVSAQSASQYEVRGSLLNNVSTVLTAEANGSIVQAYTTDVAIATAGGLSASTDYFFNIIVKDAAGSKAVYATVLVHTPATSGARRRGQVTSQ
jgi:predicted alternative tryptophan synthase beta-subunit